MAKPSDSPGFKKLLAYWNQALADSGFRDAEELRNNELRLKQTGSMGRYKQSHEIVRAAKEQYYSVLVKKVSQTHFVNELEHQIMLLYSEGLSQVAIKQVLNIKGHRCKVYYPLYKWLKAWGLK